MRRCDCARVGEESGSGGQCLVLEGNRWGPLAQAGESHIIISIFTEFSYNETLKYNLFMWNLKLIIFLESNCEFEVIE